MDNKERNNRDKPNDEREDSRRSSNFSQKRPFKNDYRGGDQGSERPRKFGANDFNDKKIWKKQDDGRKPWEAEGEDLKDFEKEIAQEKGRAAKFKEDNKKKFSKEDNDDLFEDDVPFNVKPVKKSSKVNIRPNEFFDDDDLDEGIGGYQKIKKTKK